MKFLLRSFGLSSLFYLVSGSYSLPRVMAQCVQADVSVQYSISGSPEPTERTNDVDLQSDRACRGNASITTGVQGNIGGRGIRQTRTVRHRFTNTGDEGNYLGTTVQIQSNPAIDVYNAADNLDY